MFAPFRILEARIWLKNINDDMAEMNKVWNQWVDPQNKVDFFLEVRGTRLWSGMHL